MDTLLIYCVVPCAYPFSLIGPTTVNTGDGDDFILIGGVNGVTNVTTGAGRDTIALGDPQPDSITPFNRLRQEITLDGGTDSDTYRMIFAGNAISVYLYAYEYMYMIDQCVYLRIVYYVNRNGQFHNQSV